MAREAYAGGDEEAWRNAEPSACPLPVEAAAVELLKPRKDKLSDALEVYLSAHVKGDSANRRGVVSDALSPVRDRQATCPVEIRRLM